MSVAKDLFYSVLSDRWTVARERGNLQTDADVPPFPCYGPAPSWPSEFVDLGLRCTPNTDPSGDLLLGDNPHASSRSIRVF